MHVIQADNVNSALSKGLRHLLDHGVEEPSRNGPVLVAPTPVTTVYDRPWERVLFSPCRDANPFFHLMESLWMLAGRYDLALPKYFNSSFGKYSDNGVTVRGAYGHRWRKWFGYDQLEVIAKELKANPASRRCVLAMWDAGATGYWYDQPGTEVPEDPSGDLLADTVDKPCNTHIYFRVNNGKLDMTVCCRSNDVLWGAYGANAVHMSILQEFMAAWIGVMVGKYYQVSNNFHLYTEVLDREAAKVLVEESVLSNVYLAGIHLVPLVNEPIALFQGELLKFLHDPQTHVESRFLREVAQPMYLSYMARKMKRGDGLAEMSRVQAFDWSVAGKQWIARRSAKRG